MSPTLKALPNLYIKLLKHGNTTVLTESKLDASENANILISIKEYTGPRKKFFPSTGGKIFVTSGASTYFR